MLLFLTFPYIMGIVLYLCCLEIALFFKKFFNSFILIVPKNSNKVVHKAFTRTINKLYRLQLNKAWMDVKLVILKGINHHRQP